MKYLLQVMDSVLNNLGVNWGSFQYFICTLDHIIYSPQAPFNFYESYVSDFWIIQFVQSTISSTNSIRAILKGFVSSLVG